MAKCITCGTELHPERARKYDYCMAPECQQKNAKGLTIAAVGMNKSGEEFVILDDRTRAERASGRYHDQRRGSFGTSQSAPPAPRAAAKPAPARTPPATTPAPTTTPTRGAATAPAPPPAAAPPSRAARRPPTRRSQAPARGPWTRSQEKLALLYNEQRMKPGEIADKLGISTYLVTQIILAAKNRGKI
jgi:hypothetical protein